MALLAALIGLVHGWLNGTGMGLSIAAVVAIALVAALCVALRSPWARVAVRALGSWISAIGLLMLGWTLRAAAASSRGVVQMLEIDACATLTHSAAGNDWRPAP